MLDVILYGNDSKGQLTLRERGFADAGELTSYLSSPKGERWSWAEVEGKGNLVRSRVVRCEPDSILSRAKPARRVSLLRRSVA